MFNSGFKVWEIVPWKPNKEMQDKREIGYCTDRLEKVQYLKRVIKYNYRTSDKKLKNISNLENRIILRIVFKICGRDINRR